MLINNEINYVVQNKRTLIYQIQFSPGNEIILRRDVMYFVGNLPPFIVKGVIIWCLVLVGPIHLYHTTPRHNPEGNNPLTVFQTQRQIITQFMYVFNYFYSNLHCQKYPLLYTNTTILILHRNLQHALQRHPHQHFHKTHHQELKQQNYSPRNPTLIDL